MVKKMKNKKAAIVFLLVGILLIGAVFTFVKPKTNTVDNINEETSNSEIIVKTDYCDLYYPSAWQENIKIQQEEKTVRFLAEIEGYETQSLFDIHFGSNEGTLYGTVLVNDTEVTLSTTVYPIIQNEGWDQASVDMLYGMQEDLNHLLAKLPVVNLYTAQNAALQEDIDMEYDDTEYDDIEINTPYGQLRFPGRWEPYLRTGVIEEEVYVIEFYANVKDYPEQHLFDVLIGKDIDGEFQLLAEDGNAYTLSIQYVLSEVDTAWAAEDADILYGMMEGTNDLIMSLNSIE